MSVLKKPKRRPFGTSAGNALLLKKRSGHKAADGHRERGRDPSPRGERKRPANAIESRHRGRSKGKEGKGASFRIHVDNDARKAPSKGLEKRSANAAKRRDSKTPRTNNLSSVPGAYDLAKEFDSHRPRAKQPAKKAAPAEPRQRHRPDPSPIKRPDPSAPKHARSKAKSSSTTAKRGGSVKRDNFVSASLKRLFTPKESEKSQLNANYAAAERRGEPSGASPPGRREASSDMDTACSTPEKDSPLVTSPLTKPDPIARDVAEKAAPFDRKEKAGKGSTYAASRSEGVTPSIPNLGRATAPPIAPKKDVFQNDQAKGVPQEVLDRARSGPMDNKRVLKAMFNSGSRRPPPPAEKAEAADSLVGSIIGPATLQRSYSADESVLTIMDGVDDASQASMTTRAETARGGIAHHRNAPTQRSDTFSDIFRSKAPTNNPNNVSSLHQEIRRANAINEVPTNQTYTVQLPAGWREKWSKSKQKPYYVHPDFGTTWHCPGLPSIASVLAGQSELYDDQRVPLGMSQQAFFSSYASESAGGTHESRARSGWTADSSGQGPFHGDKFQASQRTDASRMAGSTHVHGSRLNGDANDYASFSMPKSTNASSAADSAQGIGATNDGISTSNFNAHVKEASREEAAGGVNRGKDVSSTESFSKCYTQDFGSDDCVASTNGHVGNGEESRANEKNQNQLHDQFSVRESDSIDYDGQGGGFDALDGDGSLNREVMEREQTLDDASVDFNNDQGGGFDDLDDESRGQSDAQELDPSLGGVEEASVDSSTNLKDEDEKQLDPPQNNAKETQGQASDVDGGSVLDTIAEDRGELNSDKLLRHGAKRGKSPLLSTIKESPNNFSCHSSVVSPDEGSDDDDDLAGLKVLDDSKDEPRKKKHSLESLQSVGDDNSPNDFGNADDQSPMFENDGGGAISDIDSSGSQADKSLEGKSQRKSSGITGLNLDAVLKEEAKKAPRCKKKIFPPGPLCSLQFLEEIENDEFDTPLWRRMKRRRTHVS